MGKIQLPILSETQDNMRHVSCCAGQVRLLLLIKDKRGTGKAQQGLERLGKAQGEGKDRRRVRCTDCTSSARDSREGGGAPPSFNNIPEGNTDRAIFSVLSRY